MGFIILLVRRLVSETVNIHVPSETVVHQKLKQDSKDLSLPVWYKDGPII